ncbi:MAG: tetratricopeptide repeat protein [bacterium]
MPSEKIDSDSPILVADGDPGVQAALKRFLSEFQLRNVTYIDDGYKATHSGRFNRFSCIILGQALEKTDGIKVLAALRAEGKNTKTPLVFLFGDGEEALAKEAEAAGASGTLAKPVKADSLRSLIESLLDRYIVTKTEEAAKDHEYQSATFSAVDRGKELLAKGDYEGAEEAFEEAMVTGGGSEDVFNGLAVVYLAKGDKEAAEQVLIEAERLDPLAREKFRFRAPSFIEEGNKNLEAGLFEAAKNSFEGAIVADEKIVAGHAGLSESLMALEDEEGAEKAYNKALEIEDRPEDLHVYNRMGMFARRRKQFLRALRAYDRALTFNPEDHVLYYNKSLVHVATKDFKEAINLLKKALELKPDFPEAKEVAQKVVAWLKSKSSSG